MSQQIINLGTVDNDDTGDTIKAGGDKINDNFTEVYSTLDDLDSGKQDTLTISTVGNNLVSLTNPSAITFVRLNANNTVDTLNAADFKTALSITTFDPHSPGAIGNVARGSGAFEPLDAFGIATFWDGINLKFSSTLNVQDGVIYMNATGVGMNATKTLAWSPDSGVVSSPFDLFVKRATAGVLAITDATGMNGTIQLKSPDGTAYNITVSNIGVLTVTAA